MKAPIYLLVLVLGVWGIQHKIPLDENNYESTFSSTASKTATSTYTGFSGSVTIPPVPVLNEKGSQYSLTVELDNQNNEQSVSFQLEYSSGSWNPMLLYDTPNKTNFAMYAGWNSQSGDVIQFASILFGGNWTLYATVPGRTPLNLGPFPSVFNSTVASVEFSGDIDSCGNLPGSGKWLVDVTFSKVGGVESGWAFQNQQSGSVECSVHVSNATDTTVAFVWSISS